jgi:plasmid stability protein
MESTSRHGAIADDKCRMTIILPKEVRDALRIEAATQGRTMSNYVSFLLTRHVHR